MDNSKNEDIFKLISQILEYTDNPTGSTPSDPETPPPSTPPCKCKPDGDCGSDIIKDCPEAFATKDVLCFCADDPLKKCPVCPPSCGCKSEGKGTCGDDTSLCEPDPVTGLYAIQECSCDGTIIFCPKCPVITPSLTPCYCYDCGYGAFDSGGCKKQTCQSGDCSPPKEDCFICETETPTPSCDSSGPCVCDSGTDCGNCAGPDFECVGKHMETCGNGCEITCGSCEPATTFTPPSPTNTKLCPCDCAMYSSAAACEDAKHRYCTTGKCKCLSNPCSGPDCQKNNGCTDLNIDYTPSPTPSNTCPTDCEQLGCFEPTKNCIAYCLPNGNDAAACCKLGHCPGPQGCAPLSCDRCWHQPKVCKSKNGFSTHFACMNGRDPLLVECKDCGEFGFCDKYEACFCVVPKITPSGSPTLTPCSCQDYQGVVDPGHCGAAGACQPNFQIRCPDLSTITCDICCTPTGTDTCVCEYPCFDDGADCQQAKTDIENSDPTARCSCSNWTCSQTSNKNCVCLECTYSTPSPSPSPSCGPRPEGCCIPPVCHSGRKECQACREWTEYRRVPGDPSNCPGWECGVKEITGSIASVRTLGANIWNPQTNSYNCVPNGRGCTTATGYVCFARYEVYPLQNASGPGDGVTNC